MANKLTIKEQFVMVNEVLKAAGRDDLVEFINGRIEVQGKKHSSKKQTATQKANEELKNTIVEVLTGAEPMTVTDLMKSNDELGEYSNQKISALLRQLVNDKIVNRTVEKNKTYFSIA